MPNNKISKNDRITDFYKETYDEIHALRMQSPHPALSLDRIHTITDLSLDYMREAHRLLQAYKENEMS